jgi:hypothetical protein
MTTTINASPTNGLVATGDGSGVLKVQSNGVTTNALAWVNFNGTGTVAIRASYNVSSITDNGTGDYTVNFATALTDANYALVNQIIPTNTAFGSTARVSVLVAQTTTTAQIRTGSLSISQTVTAEDEPTINVAIFGN